MKIFILDKKKIINYIDKSSFDNVYNSKKRNEEFILGRFLIKYIASTVFHIKNTEIKLTNKKPTFINSDIKFSLSHSADYIAVAFSKYETGLDIEIYKPRKLDRLSNYFKKEFRTLDEFYQYWTQYEANFKNHSKPDYTESFKFENYFCSISSENKTELKIYEVAMPTPITSPMELINLKLVNDSNINDIKLVINEINTASLEFLPPLAINIE